MNQRRWRMLGIVLVFLSIIGIAEIGLSQRSKSQTETMDQSEHPQEKKEELTEVVWRYPKKIVLGENYSDLIFVDNKGKQVSIKRQEGNYTMLTYWASWCPHCEDQMKVLKEVLPVLEREQINCILIDKLDGEKETIEQAEDYLAKNEINIPVVYDKALKVYDKLGICIVPTTLFLNPDGELVFCHAGVIDSMEEFSSMISYVKNGPEKDLRDYIMQCLMGEDGGLHTNMIEKKGEAPCGYDVLSESQGLLMLYAAAVEDSSLFQQTFSYVKENLYRNNLAIWVNSNKTEAQSNALLDDLRMLKALTIMSEVDAAYQKEAEKLSQAITRLNMKENQPRDFYDFSCHVMGERFTLCYADFMALKTVSSQNPDVGGVYDSAIEIVEKGYISDEFPFYYNYYDYKKKEYDLGSINMAEGMYTLLHLAEAGQLKAESVAWLKEQLLGNGIWARYDVNGNVVEGYEYQSTAVYALTGLIALELEDSELLTMAVSRMEANRCFDSSNPVNGAFGTEPSNIMSYDQCMALLLYGRMRARYGVIS